MRVKFMRTLMASLNIEFSQKGQHVSWIAASKAIFFVLLKDVTSYVRGCPPLFARL